MEYSAFYLNALYKCSEKYAQEQQEHDEKRQQWERTKVINGVEWLTEWGAGLLVAEGLGETGYDARNTADREGLVNSTIREAIHRGELPAISESGLGAIRAERLGKFTWVLIKKTDFDLWLVAAYPTIAVNPTIEPLTPQVTAPVPVKGSPESLQEWIKYIITVEKGLSLVDRMPDGLQAELIRESMKYGYKDASAVKRAWSRLGLNPIRETVKMQKPPKAP